MNEHDLVRLRHMLDAAHESIHFIENHTRSDFDADRLLQLAEIRLIEVIGEAARSISQETRETTPQIDWKSIVGMRDRLIHGYFNVDLNLVWEVLTQDLPALVIALEAIIPE